MHTNVSMTIILADNMLHMEGFESKKKIFPFENVDVQCLHPEQPGVEVNPFEIFRDESEVQERGRNSVFCAPQPERKVDQFMVFRDETEGMQQVQNGSGSLSDPIQYKLEAGWILRDNFQAPSKERSDNEMYEPTKVIDENCQPSCFRDDNIPELGTDELWCPEIQTCNCENGLNPQSTPCSHIKIIIDAPVAPGM
jgi:hypothetical protein